MEELADRSAAPTTVRTALTRLLQVHPTLEERLRHDPALARAMVAALGASRPFGVLLGVDPIAIEVLADLGHRPEVTAETEEQLLRWKQREELRIATRDLLGLDPLETTVAAIAEMARDVLDASCRLAGTSDLAVIGMGKLGGNELNYSSDIDVMFVTLGAASEHEKTARAVLRIARSCFRVDANLRPQGRDGPLVRSLDSYSAYWERWAEPWEFQALLKARFAAGDEKAGEAFETRASEVLWARTFSADDLRYLRQMKARAEAEVERKGLSDREVKRGRGGIRDIEFAVQLLQLVHGRHDENLRSPTTLDVLGEMGDAGYIDTTDVSRLADAYRFLRTLEHRLQLVDGQQVHTMPTDETSRDCLARTMGFRDHRDGSAVELLDKELSRHQTTVRAIHERVYFRPLLEAFGAIEGDLLLRPGAAEERATAFGFADALRTKAAVRELTRGLSRSSRLMQQMLPLLFAWLSESPDPDLGLLALRNLISDRARAEQLAVVFRDSPEVARRLCVMVGTSRLVSDLLLRNADVIARLGDAAKLKTSDRETLVERATTAVEWRSNLAERQRGLMRWKDRNLIGIAARDLLGESDVLAVGHDLTAVAEASLEVALASMEPKLPFAVIGLGRFGGSQLSYASDLDVVFVYDGTTASDYMEAERLASQLRRFVDGPTPAERIWELDADLRPEGKKGPLARSIEGYRAYFSRWALVWERQAMVLARPVAGDPSVAAKFMGLLDDFTWEPGLSEDDVREIRRMKARIERERIPPGEDPQFHLKLGRGSLSDVEFTAQLLQLKYRVRSTGTIDALDRLVEEDVLDAHDRDILVEAYRFCESTRNRLFLVRSAPGNSLPAQNEQLRWLARSLETKPNELREHYRRVTRRSRAVVERVFYGNPG